MESNQVVSLPRWYALRTRPRAEKQVRNHLEANGIEQILPLVKCQRQWKDRKKEIEVPLFSGYCFARFTVEERLSVVTISGVQDIVGSGHVPEPIPDCEIEGVKTLLNSQLNFGPHPYLQEGRWVEVKSGPLQGVRGILIKKPRKHRLVIGVSLLQQGAEVEINADDVVPV